MVKQAILCQSCGIEAPTKYVEFRQNIGMLVMRRHRTIKANLCKPCMSKYFRNMTLTTFFLGPWGTISLILAPTFIIMNLVQYFGAIGMEAVPVSAMVPVLTPEAIAKLKPYTVELGRRLSAGEPLVDIARAIGPQARVTPGTVVKYAIAVAQQNRPQPTLGFPVVPITQPPAMPTEPIPIEQIPDNDFPDAPAADR